jgi:hypothetical protein
MIHACINNTIIPIIDINTNGIRISAKSTFASSFFRTYFIRTTVVLFVPIETSDSDYLNVVVI